VWGGERNVIVCDLRVLCGSGWELRGYGLLGSEWWHFVMSYCVASGGNLLWVLVWRVVVIHNRRSKVRFSQKCL
jgi:hypothetical protein